MRSKPGIFLISCSLLFLSACGQFAYKRGAGATDLSQAQKACQTAGDEAAAEKCLEDSGWVVKNMEDMDPVAVIMPNSDNRSSAEPVMIEKEDATASASNTATSTATGSTPAPVKKTANPMDVFKISSWWKMGGNDASLNIALNECVDKLGEDHRPPADHQKATRALLICMKEKSWHGLQAR